MPKGQGLLNGKAEAEKIIKNLKNSFNKTPVKPTLAVVLVGNNPASKIYVDIKEKRAKELGINFLRYNLPTSTGEKKIINLIQELNSNKKITGIMVQLPLPKKFNTNKIISVIDKNKDVDGLTPPFYPSFVRMGKKIISPTIQSILHLIKLSKQKLVNKKAVILCNSQEFALSLQKELAKNKIKATILIKHNLKPHNSLFLIHYSLIIIALGQKYFLKPNMVQKNAVIIDVGINKIKNKVYGDVEPTCLEKTKYISPVPGGVGPLTVAYLFKNLLQLKK